MPDKNTQVRELLERILRLEDELKNREQLIAQMRREYEILANRLNEEKNRHYEEALERFITQIINHLAMLVTLANGYRNNLQVELEDVVNQIMFLEKELIALGVEPIGRVGETVEFDVSLHQPIGTSMIQDGAKALVKIQGYKFRGKILAKAIVSGAEG